LGGRDARSRDELDLPDRRPRERGEQRPRSGPGLHHAADGRWPVRWRPDLRRRRVLERAPVRRSEQPPAGASLRSGWRLARNSR
jgi:hypothetical protein